MVLLFAHRGGTDHDHPENSIAAMARALDLGLSLESDVRLSIDGVAVLVHDPYVRGDRFFPRRVRRLTAAKLAGYGVITLDELYRELGTDFELSIDVKDPAAVPATLAVADRAGATERLWLVHDSIYTLQHIRQASEAVRLMHETRLPELDRRTIGYEHHMDLLVRSRIDAQNTHWSRWTPTLVEACHSRGLLAFGSIAQRRKHMEQALAKGLDGLYTDFVQDLAEVAATFKAVSGGESELDEPA
ncbi:MAG: glycerophosphodiester phosphodiesterase [Acidimicrobiales bacterium]|nr:glycerophosphodiester phosphodiesterase [Acidimicrobiales bacterium]